MKHTHLHTRLLALLLCCALVLPLSACGEAKSTTQQIFAMDTVMDLTAYGKKADDGINALLETAQTSAAGYPVVFGRMPEADAGQMRNMWDVLRARLGQPGAAVLATEKDGKPTLLAAGTPEAVEAGFDAGAVIKAISGNIKGGGGGKAAMAQAGGKDASGIDAALQAARDMLL